MKKFPGLNLTLTERGKHLVLTDAEFRLNENSVASRKLVMDSPRGKYFHAVVILLLLAKYQGEGFADNSGAILFKNKKGKPTWIKALGTSFGKGVQQDFFFKYFSSLHFLSASRGSVHTKKNKATGKGVPPSAKYLAGQLPLENLNFLKAGRKSALEGDELAMLAERFEKQEADKLGWEAIVPEIVADTLRDRPLKPRTKKLAELSEKVDEGQSFLLSTHWRAMNEDVRREIKRKALGGDWYVVSVVPNWVGDWKALFYEAITQHQAKVRIVYQAASAADACPAIRAQLRINSSWVKEKDHAAVVRHAQDRIENAKIEMSNWITEIHEQSGRGKRAAGGYEFFESHLNHPFMAVLAVPQGTRKGSKAAAPAGTWCVIGLYPFYRTLAEKSCSVFLNSESPVLDFYYNTILDLFESGLKDGYLKPVDLLKRSRAGKEKAGSP
jgi:hypothetical protein